jgi:hypothetical protein
LPDPAGRALPGGGFATDVSRVFGWSALHAGTTVTLRRITATRDTTRITVEVTGLEPDWALAGLGGLRLEDATGRQLASAGLERSGRMIDSRYLGGGTAEGTVEVDRRVDPNAVAAVTVGQVVAARQSNERYAGTLLDAELKRRIDRNPEIRVEPNGSCPSCELTVRCKECELTRLAGSSYRGGRVVVVLSHVGGFDEAADLAANGDVQVLSPPTGQVSSLETTTASGHTVIQIPAWDLAGVSGPGNPRMPFEIVATVVRGRFTNGPWRLDQGSGRR